MNSTTVEDNLNILRKCYMFNRFSIESLQKFATFWVPMKVEVDTDLWKKDEKQEFAIIPFSGRISKVNSNNVQDIMLYDVSGFLHLVNGDTSSSLVHANKGSEFLKISRDSLLQAISDHSISVSLTASLSSLARNQIKALASLNGQLQHDQKYNIAFYDTKSFWRPFFNDALNTLNPSKSIKINFFEEKLTKETAILATNMQCVCIFVNDTCNKEVCKSLKDLGVNQIALRCAGFNNVDVVECAELKINITRVPEYSPYAVAEHSLALAFALNRKIPRAYNRVNDGNFSLDGLVGFDFHGKIVGIIGTGKIGKCAIDIWHGMGCKVLAYDVYESDEIKKSGKATYTTLDNIFASSDVISLHVPLLPSTFHLINMDTIKRMKPGVMLINVSRGSICDSNALVEGVELGILGTVGLDVIEEESQYFFQDKSGEIIKEKALARLLTLPNVLITGHQAFLTNEALTNIANTTVQNIIDIMNNREECRNMVKPPKP